MRLQLIIRRLTIEALRALGRHRVRSGLAILGITAAVATVIVVVALGAAGVQAAERELDKLGDNLVWIEAGSRTVNGARSGAHGMTTLTAKDAQAIRDEVPTIAQVSEQVDGSLLVVYGESSSSQGSRPAGPSSACS